MKIKWLRVVRDVVILTIMLFIGGFIAGAAAGGMPNTISLFVATLLMGTLGFCLCGCLTTENRWKHLFIVALGFWLTNFLPVIPNINSLSAWVFSVFEVFVPMLIGGFLASILVRGRKLEEKQVEQKGQDEIRES